MERDRLGRRRRPDQDRGLRPIHPPLPVAWDSRAVRVAMSEADWARFEAHVRAADATCPTLARAYGEAIVRLLDQAAPVPEPTPLEWLDWERRKTLRLLTPGD